MTVFEQALAVLKYLRTQGVSFWADGDDIRVYPAEKLPPEHRALIAEHKVAVVAWLKWYAAEMGCDDAAKHWGGGGDK